MKPPRGFESLRISRKGNDYAKKQPLNANAKKRIKEEIEKAFHHGWLVKSFLHRCFNKDDLIRQEWDKMMDEMTCLRESIPAEISKRISK
jgi:hypothetical protein